MYQASTTGALGMFYTQHNPLLSEIVINKPPDAYISPNNSSLQNNPDFIQCDHDIDHQYLNLSFAGKASLPLDLLTRSTFKEISMRARRVFILDREKPEIVDLVSFGRRHVRGDKEVIVAECDDRYFIAPEEDCILDIQGPAIRLWPSSSSMASITCGATSRVSACISGSPTTDDLFKCISSLCQVPGEESALRSHPFFRRPLQVSVAAGPAPEEVPEGPVSGITLSLPADLRYLYAAAPLAYYTGAGIEAGESPAISISEETLPLPGDAHKFAQWACNMLRLVFHADCALRYETTTGKKLAGFDIQADTGISAESLLSMGTSERLLTYLQLHRRGIIRQMPWHTASYVDPVPSSILLIPSLLHSLSAIFYPAGRTVTELEVVQMEVRQFLGTRYRSCPAKADTAQHVVQPVLENAFIHQWLSDGYPVDAIKQLKTPPAQASTYHRFGIPRIAIICNEDAMVSEAISIRNILKNRASIVLLRNVSPDDLISVFMEGYDIVQYIGHCDHRGLKCQGGYADLSNLAENKTPIFFFNSCSSYLQGIRLLEKGSICGIAALYRVIDEEAIDICVNFYKLLARGYPVLMAYLGAKECSVIGKEYLFLGDGCVSLFENNSSMPLYRLIKTRQGYTLSCIVTGPEKGLIQSGHDRTGPGLPDTGIVLDNVSVTAMIDDLSLPAGACVYDGKIFQSIRDAVLESLEDTCLPSVRSYTYNS